MPSDETATVAVCREQDTVGESRRCPPGSGLEPVEPPSSRLWVSSLTSWRLCGFRWKGASQYYSAPATCGVYPGGWREVAPVWESDPSPADSWLCSLGLSLSFVLCKT